MLGCRLIIPLAYCNIFFSFLLQGVLCPVCRKEIAFEMDNLPLSKPSVDETQHFIPSESLKKWQREMSNTLERQRASGGVIDVNLEKNKFLVTEVS